MVITPPETANKVMDPSTTEDRPDRHSAGQTIPTLPGVLTSYRVLEREMFADPDNAERYAELLKLTRSQVRDFLLGHRTDPQRFGGGDQRVPAYSPENIQRLLTYKIAKRIPREKTARQVAEDDLLAAGLAPILASLTIAQLDAVRHVHWFQFSQQEAADSLHIARASVRERLAGAYAKVRAAIPADGYRKVVAWLISQGQKDRAVREVQAA